MKVAVIGSGIAGMGAAYALCPDHDVRLFEADARFGGHSNTLDIAVPGGSVAVDAGFIVFNPRNYPNLCGLLAHLDVASEWSDMSFGFSLKGGAMEWAGADLGAVFAQRGNVLRPRFVRGVLDILRFNRTAARQLDAGALRGLSLGAWLARERFSDWFRDCYVLPMGGAIWSTPLCAMLDFPAESFVAFFRNHDLLGGLENRQRWRTVTGGSREYVSRITDRLGSRAVANARAVSICREAGRPRIRFADGSETVCDQVVLACHAPQALALLRDADAQERATLGAFATSRNHAILHSDPTLMPRRRRVWSSWNFLSAGPAADARAPAPVTYWMNRLQGLPRAHPVFLSLNPARMPDPALVHTRLDYAHPVLDGRAFAAQRAMPAIQGRGGVWYAGAWLGYGFHEDGLRAGLAVAGAMGARPDWAPDLPLAVAGADTKAAE